MITLIIITKTRSIKHNNKNKSNKQDNDYNDASNDIYLVKSAPIPSGGSLQILDGGAKLIVQSGDALKVVSDTASSCDVWVSTVDDISS